MIITIIVINNKLFYTVKFSNKVSQSSLIGDTVHNTGTSLLLSASVWVLLMLPFTLERIKISKLRFSQNINNTLNEFPVKLFLNTSISLRDMANESFHRK